MSRAEEITSEVRKLVLTCRSLEAQLQQSMPKKTHQEIVAKMQASIDAVTAELGRTRTELETTTTIGQRISTLEAQISSQSETISSQSRTIESLSSKLSEATVPFPMYTEALSKLQEAQASIATMVNKSDYAAAQVRCAELEEQIRGMVPRAQCAVLEIELANSVPIAKYEELRQSLERMVPKEELAQAESRIAELEKALSNTVPRQDFEELTARITQITREAEEVASRMAPTAQVEMFVEAQPPRMEETPIPTETAPTAIVEPASEIVQQSPAEQVIQTVQSANEISEVQSQLSDINSTIETGATTTSAPAIVSDGSGFRFANTDFCARSGLEFLQDLEKVDAAVIATHLQNGDFERWFRDVLTDQDCATSLQGIRDSNATGEELRAMLVAVVAPRYRH
ncbi:MAG: hypothetical protein ACYCQJ_06575 [Nitrososphaerales archaeon]